MFFLTEKRLYYTIRYLRYPVPLISKQKLGRVTKGYLLKFINVAKKKGAFKKSALNIWGGRYIKYNIQTSILEIYFAYNKYSYNKYLHVSKIHCKI